MIKQDQVKLFKDKYFEYWNSIIPNPINACHCDYFGHIYKTLTEYVYYTGIEVNSRVGKTKEVLNFKTIIENPLKRCVGLNDRDTNIFFLLAESLWILAGREDLDFLKLFNARMKNYSDDGKTFHGAYGKRIRNWNGKDQLKEVLILLDKDLGDRRAVVGIWNPELDLGVVSKDIPCNDLLMFKARTNKLYLTIANRSNDLHWGLCTNIFQFSMLSELMVLLLNQNSKREYKLTIGKQVHISQSLHIYDDNEITNKLLESTYENELYKTLGIEPTGMDFNFLRKENVKNCVENDLEQVSDVISVLIEALLVHEKEIKEFDNVYFGNLGVFEIRTSEISKYFYGIFLLLKIFIEFKVEKKVEERGAHYSAIEKLIENKDNILQKDYLALSLNWFYQKLKKDYNDVPRNFDKDLEKLFGINWIILGNL